MHIKANASATLLPPSPIWLDWLCAALGIFLLSNALLFLLVGLEEDTLNVILAAGNSQDYRTKQAVFAAAYVLAGLLLASRSQARHWRLYGWPLVLLMVLPALSALWSADPGLTLRRSLSLWGTTLFGLYLGVVFTEMQLRRLVALSAFMGALASVMVIVVMGDRGTMEYGEAGSVWQGAYSHKNTLALNMGLGLLCLLAPRPGQPHGPLALFASMAVGGLMAVLMVGANSATACLVLACALAVGWTLPRDGVPAHRWFLLAAACFALAGLTPLVLALDKALVLDLMGRDASLTNRVPLWQFVAGRVLDKPLLGWGYEVFFSGLDAPAAEHWLLSGLMEIHSHNGYLQLTVNTGLVGLAAFVMFLNNYLNQLEKLAEWRWHVMVLIFLLGYNITEVGLVSPHSVVWTLFMASRTRAMLA